MPRFVSYFMLTDRHQQWMKNHCSGAATMASLNQEILGRIDIPLVELPIQRKIAAVLGAYDDLIENSGRRIKVLEEMAQRVYREWFVNFRYPGHDGVPMGDSELGLIPDGWKVGTIGEVLEVMESGSRPKGGIDPTERGVPSVGAENILGLGRYDFGREKFVSTSFFEQMRRGRVVNGDVVLYKDGAYIGRVSLFRDGFPHDECAVNEHVFILRTNTHFSQSMMYFWLADAGNQDRVRSLNANSAQPGIVKHFTERVEPILAMLFNLARSLPLLKNARDLLLPRLISGEIDVSDFDIMTPSEAA
jgi:type I restriction enzyme S subunit